MRLSYPAQCLSLSMNHAAQFVHPDRLVHEPGLPDALRRPDPSECTVEAMFMETWGSRALGFGGWGGSAMTPAYTVVIRGPDDTLAVYWDGRFAYSLHLTGLSELQRCAWDTDMARRLTASRSEAIKRYGVELPSGD